MLIGSHSWRLQGGTEGRETRYAPPPPPNHRPAGEASDIIQPDSNDICVLPQSSCSLDEQLVLWVSLAHSLSPSQIKHCVAVFHHAVCAVAGGNCAPTLGLPSPHLQRSRAGCRADALSTVVVEVVEVVVLVLQTLRRTTGPTPETSVDTSTDGTTWDGEDLVWS